MATLNIKNMVCDRCKKVVKDRLEGIGLELHQVELGKVHYENPQNISLDKIKRAIEDEGFALLDSISRIVIIGLVKNTENCIVQIRKSGLKS